MLKVHLLKNINLKMLQFRFWDKIMAGHFSNIFLLKKTIK